MCKEHVDEGKSISHVCELHRTVDKDDFKYYVNLYKRYGESPFINRENGIVDFILEAHDEDARYKK